MQKLLILAGGLLIALGLLWARLRKLPFGHLPGDIFIKREGFQFFFPLTTCLLISIVLTLLFWIFRK